MLLALLPDLLKLILAYLRPRELSLVAPVCHKFNSFAKQLLVEKAFAGRTLSEYLVEAYRLLEPHLKPWQRYLLIRASFHEVDLESPLLIDIIFCIQLAIQNNQTQLVSVFIDSARSVIDKTSASFKSGYFQSILMASAPFAPKEALLEFITKWPKVDDIDSDDFSLIPVGFLSKFTESERKFIVSKYKPIKPIALHLARKAKFDFTKLTPEQQSSAYDCFPEEQLNLIRDQKLRAWAQFCFDVRKGYQFNQCDNPQHSYWDQAWIIVLETYISLLKKFNIDYQIKTSFPKYCFWQCS